MKNIALLFLALTVVTACNVNNDEFKDVKTSVNDSKLTNENSLTSVIASDSFTTEEKKNVGISKCLLVQPEKFVVNPTSDTSITIGKRGTTIHIPSDAFVDKYGCLISLTGRKSLALRRRL